MDLLIGDSKISNEFGLINDWKYPAINSPKFSFGMNTFCHQACIFKRSSLDLWNGFPLVDHFDWLTTFYFTKELETKLTQSQAIQDSIKEEMFVMDIDLGRYEFVIESLDTNCKEKALNILSNTE